MASDLSTLIENGLCSTLNSLLSKETSLQSIHKADAYDIADTQTLNIEATFEFDKITSTWNFIIPAYSASYIFNCMLGDDSEPSNEINADIADAIGEFISNIAGGLATSINGAGYEDLTGAKFTIGDNTTQEANSIDNFDNMFKFTLDLDGKEVLIFIQFDNVILPFIEHISNSPSTQREDESNEEKGEEIDLSEIENLDSTPDEEPQQTQENSDTSEDSKENNENNENQNEEKEDNSSEQEELTDEEKKAKKLKMIIIGVGATLGLVIIAAIVLYFLGWFDPPPPPKVPEKKVTKKVNKDGIEVVNYPTQRRKPFDTSKINVKRLNARLALLTKYDFKQEEVDKEKMLEEEYKKREQERLKALKLEQEALALLKAKKEKEAQEKKILQEKLKAKKDTIVLKEKPKPKVVKKAPPKKVDIAKKEILMVEKYADNKLHFIASNILKYRAYKQLLLRENVLMGKISICRDETDNTIIYIGPFDGPAVQNNVLKTIKAKHDKFANNVILTNKQFDQRCNF